MKLISMMIIKISAKNFKVSNNKKINKISKKIIKINNNHNKYK